jgi:hypothetical protein
MYEYALALVSLMSQPDTIVPQAHQLINHLETKLSSEISKYTIYQHNKDKKSIYADYTDGQQKVTFLLIQRDGFWSKTISSCVTDDRTVLVDYKDNDAQRTEFEEFFINPAFILLRSNVYNKTIKRSQPEGKKLALSAFVIRRFKEGCRGRYDVLYPDCNPIQHFLVQRSYTDGDNTREFARILQKQCDSITTISPDTRKQLLKKHLPLFDLLQDFSLLTDILHMVPSKMQEAPDEQTNITK